MSHSPKITGLIIQPRHFRETYQKSSKIVAEKIADQIQGFSSGNFDGRFWSSFPGTTYPLENDQGFFYHVVGSSVGLDMSVAAP